MVVSNREFIVVTVGSVVLSLLALYGVSAWSRRPARLLVIAITTTVAIVAWNVVLNVTNAAGFNVDGPLGLSFQDAGSGALAFGVVAAVLGLATDRSAPAGRVVGAAAIVGLVTTFVDLFA